MLRERRRTARQRSRLCSFLAALGLAAVLASIGIGACSDTLPVAPDPVAPPEPALSTHPTEGDYAEMPVEFREKSKIEESWVDVGFVSSQGYGSAYMKYFANYARITLPVTLLYNNSHVTTTTGSAEEAHWLPTTRGLNAVASVGVNGSCGHTVNATAIFYIHNQFPLSKGWFEWDKEGHSKSTSRSQPACSCSGSTSLTDPAYDPYGNDGGEMVCGNGGTSGGSGIPYDPGDHSGGETVDFGTGVGNGGSSACGAAAVVEYVCIDIWDGERKIWVEYACGYVTTC